MSATPDRDPETVDLFVEESLEALQRVEQSLLEVEAGKPPKNWLTTLFRDFHTLKGSAGFLAYERTQRLSHAAEDLLAKLRDNVLTPIQSHFALLLTTCDALRRLLTAIKSTSDEDATEVNDLITRLRAAAEGKSSPSAGDQHPAAAAPIAAHDVEIAGLREMQIEERGQDATARADASDGTVRVNVGVLDQLMNLIGELVLARNQVVQIVKNMSENTVQSQAACHRLSLVTSELQGQIMKTRMQPVARVFEKIPRMVRDLCNQTGKQVTPRIEGTATEIDKTIVEAIRDPVMHIVRNAIDHGIESPEERAAAGKSPTGQLRVSAAHEGGTVVIEVADDGKGMDPKALRAHAVKKGLLTQVAADRLSDREALDLVFRPGFSTAKAVTDISGRGVGMDVVRSHVERASGQVELDSVAGRGTTIRLKMPLTLAIIPALLVRTGGQHFAIPQVALLELVFVNEEQMSTAIETVRGASIYRLRGEVLPLVDLAQILRLPMHRSGGVNIVVVGVGTRRYGLIVDQIHDTEEIVIKPLQGTLKDLDCYAGATVLGDGGVALILEIAGIAAMSGIDISSRRAAESEVLGPRRVSGPQQYVVFESGDRTQCAVPLAMVARLEKIEARAIEKIAGREVVQYRDTIMPIARLDTLMPIGKASSHDEIPLIVFDFGKPVALAANRIVDVVELSSADIQAESKNAFALGKAVVAGHTTLLIDVYSVVRKLMPEFVFEAQPKSVVARVLLVDGSSAMRVGLASYLRSSGIEVTEVATAEAGLAELKSQSAPSFGALIIDVATASETLESLSGLDLVQFASQDGQRTPVLVWTFEQNPALAAAARQSGATAVINKLNREQLVDCLAQLGLLSATAEVVPPAQQAIAIERDISGLELKRGAL